MFVLQFQKKNLVRISLTEELNQTFKINLEYYDFLIVFLLQVEVSTRDWLQGHAADMWLNKSCKKWQAISFCHWDFRTHSSLAETFSTKSVIKWELILPKMINLCLPCLIAQWSPFLVYNWWHDFEFWWNCAKLHIHSIATNKTSPDCVIGWLNYVEQFNYYIDSIPAKDNAIDDTLSWLDCLDSSPLQRKAGICPQRLHLQKNGLCWLPRPNHLFFTLTTFTIPRYKSYRLPIDIYQTKQIWQISQMTTKISW